MLVCSSEAKLVESESVPLLRKESEERSGPPAQFTDMDCKRAHISWLFLLIFILTAGVSPLHQDGMVAAVGRKGVEAIKELRDRLTARRLLREETRQSNREVCYDVVGCFIKPLKPSPFKKFPESPEDVGTKFLLFTRTNGSYNPDKQKSVKDAQLLINGDSSQSLTTSDFNAKKRLKMLIHGFKGKGHDKSVIIGINALLKLDDENIVVVDWEKGAAGPSYTQAVANTELVGRQTALILLDMIRLGLHPANIHLIGFSLGAHIAGCAADIVEQHTGKKIGRITGLDPASPIFRRNILLDLHRKLDANDAEFVDVIHTDGSPVWTNGFGLLQPIGHVDFFPNGGQEQPGCTDGRASVVVSHFDGNLDINSACSHLRAWHFFLESIVNHYGACQFKAYPCHPDFPGLMKGSCFPYLEKCAEDNSDSCGIMGISAQKSKARGPLYLVTRASAPYCGEQLRATVLISEKTQRTRGILHLTLQHGNHTTNFQINCEYSLLDVVQGGRMMWGLAAAEYGSTEPKTTPTIKGKLAYRSLSFQMPTSSEENSDVSLSSDIYLDQVSVVDTRGNNWQYCGKDTLLQDKRNYAFDEVTIILSLSPCLP